METVGVAVVGLGYWGPNLVRNFSKTANAEVLLGCDLSADLCNKIKIDFPNLETTQDFAEVLARDDIHLVAIATPVAVHYTLAKQALEAGKHVMVEKPMTMKLEEAEELVALAKEKGVYIALDHPFVFSAPVEKMKELKESGSLGDLLYYDSARINLGLFRDDVNVIWDLLPHDISILDYLVNEMPTKVQAFGKDHFNRGNVDTAYVTLQYASGFSAQIDLSWTSPVKLRRTILGATKQMVVIDDIHPDEKLKVYDKGVDQDAQLAEETSFRPVYRSGDVLIPRLDGGEPLHKETTNIVEAIRGNAELRASGAEGLRCMRILTALDESLATENSWVTL